jgi:hypothetical protein
LGVWWKDLPEELFMGKVIFDISISLDGFITAAKQDWAMAVNDYTIAEQS